MDNAARHRNLQKNLARVRRKNTSLADAIAELGDEGIEYGIGPRGHPTVAVDGQLLASAYDPVSEGRRLAAEMAGEQPPDVLIVLGFALGHQLEAYRAEHAGPIVVYEPSLPRLRGALAVRENMMLLGADDFEITSDADYLIELFNRFYTSGIRLQVFPMPAMSQHRSEKVVEAVKRVRRAKEAFDMGALTRINKSMVWAMLTAEHADHLRRTPNLSALYDAFVGVPAVVAAAGPSLNKQLPLLAELQDRVLIIAIGQTLGALRQAGIEPHLVHILESQNVIQQLSKFGTSDDVNLVVTPDTNTALFEVNVRSRFVAVPVFNEIAKWLVRPHGIRRFTSGGGSVAQGAVGIALALGCRDILLIGQDLAFTNDRIYAEGSAYDCVTMIPDGNNKIRLGNSKEKGRLLQIDQKVDEVEKATMWVDDWHQEGRIRTCYSYATFIEQYRNIGPQLSRLGCNLINCTEGGAHIPNLEHRVFAEALEELAGERVDPLDRILEAHDAWEAPEVEAYEDMLENARETLSRVERNAERGLKESQKAQRELPRASGPKRQIDILRRVGKMERRVKNQLVGTAWLDQMVQPQIYGVRAKLRKADAVLPTPEQAVEESIYLFEATLAAVELGHRLFDNVEQALFETRALKPEAGPSEAGASANSHHPSSGGRQSCDHHAIEG